MLVRVHIGLLWLYKGCSLTCTSSIPLARLQPGIFVSRLNSTTQLFPSFGATTSGYTKMSDIDAIDDMLWDAATNGKPKEEKPSGTLGKRKKRGSGEGGKVTKKRKTE
jgi:hypothetical protein